MPKYNRPVGWSEDLRRVASLPTRTWDLDVARRLSEVWSPQLLTERGLAEWQRMSLLAPEVRERALADFARDVCPLRLTPEQMMCLYDFVQCRGLITLAPVGVGKTLLLFLVAALSEHTFGTKRAALVVPAYLRDDTLRNHQKYAQYWKAPRAGVTVLSFTELGLEKHAYRLCNCLKCTNGEVVEVDGEPLRPDLLALDEADLAKNIKTSAVARRLARYHAEHMHEVITVAASGTFGDEIQDMFRLATWCLKDKAPVPFEFLERQSWSQALNYEAPRNGRAHPGALLQAFGNPPADDEHASARIAYGERLDKTPGFVIIDRPSCNTGVHITVSAAPRDAAIEAEFAAFRETGMASDGWVLGDSLSKTDYAVSLGCGYTPHWDPRPPVEWLEKRNAYNTLVSETIKASWRRGRPIDTEKQARKFIKNHIATLEWLEIEPTFTPNPRPIPVSPSVLNYAREWLQRNDPGIVWVDSTWFGNALAQLTGVRYLSSKGRDAFGREAEPGQSIIASMNSNQRGRDWWRWNRNLIIASPSSNTWHEQIIGRTHRQGQRLDVFVEYLVTSAETLNALDKANNRAQGTSEQYKLRPKILTATWDWSGLPREIESPWLVDDPGFQARWVRRDTRE